MGMEPGLDTTTTDRTGRTLAWVIGVIVVGVVLLTAGVIVVAALLVVRTGDPGELGPSPTPAGGPLAEADRCRAEQPVSMQIDFVAPAGTIEGAESAARSQVGEAYAVTTWEPIRTGADGSSWYGVSADGTVVAVFDVEPAGTGWVVGDIRRC